MAASVRSAVNGGRIVVLIVFGYDLLDTGDQVC